MTQERKNVLVVDDDDAVRTLMVSLLKSRGFGVFEARNGLEAIQVFASYHSEIGFVISDVEMPVMDGLEAVGRMLAIDPGARVLMVSGRTEQFESGAPGRPWLQKPFTVKQFFETLQKV